MGGNSLTSDEAELLYRVLASARSSLSFCPSSQNMPKIVVRRKDRSEHDLLNERLANSDQHLDIRQPAVQDKAEVAQPAPSAVRSTVDFSQWSSEANECFRPSGPRRPTLERGVYEVNADNWGLFFRKLNVVTDNLIELDDSASQRVLHGLRVSPTSGEKRQSATNWT